MKYEILEQNNFVRVKVTLSRYYQPDKSIQQLEKMGIFRETADANKVRDLLSKDGYILGEGSGPKISNFSNGFVTTGIYEFKNLDPNRPKPARKSAPRKQKEESFTTKTETVSEKTVETKPAKSEAKTDTTVKKPVETKTSENKKQSKTMKRRSNN